MRVTCGSVLSNALSLSGGEMEAFMAWLKSVNDVVWGPGMLVLLVGTGLYLTVGLKFFTFRNFLEGSKTCGPGVPISPSRAKSLRFNALMTALAADIGTGNIVGVSTAIYIGGPGALFWMWVTALVGMATKFSEVLLSVHFREKTPAGNWVGGAHVLHQKRARTQVDVARLVLCAVRHRRLYRYGRYGTGQLHR